MSLFEDFNRHVSGKSEPVIPSPLYAAKAAFTLVAGYARAVRAYTHYIQREQEAFQGRLENLGISRVMTMKHQDVIELCSR